MERFLTKVDKTDTCWLWTGCLDKDGYGMFFLNKKCQKTHRISFILHGGLIPDGHVIRHKCRNRNCVNPDHLETGTQADNLRDTIRDGMTNRRIKSPQHKLTEDQVKQIRISNKSNRELGNEYNIHEVSVARIKTKKSWSWL